MNTQEMYYWYGWRIFDKEIDSEPCKKTLSVPQCTYEEAKQDRERLKANDIEITSIFEATQEVWQRIKWNKKSLKTFSQTYNKSLERNI